MSELISKRRLEEALIRGLCRSEKTDDYKKCRYNTGKCEDCLFFNGSECADDRMEIETGEK